MTTDPGSKNQKKKNPRMAAAARDTADRDASDLNSLTAQMMQLEVEDGVSQTQVNNRVREQGSRVCLDCYAVFESPTALRRHMTKRKHFKRLQDLKEDREEFAERVAGRSEEDWTDEERATSANLKMRFANLLFFYRR